MTDSTSARRLLRPDELLPSKKTSGRQHGYLVVATPPLDYDEPSDTHGKRSNGRPAPTAELIRERLDYDPETGVFRWKVSYSNRTCVGAIAGSLCKNGYLYIGIGSERYTAQHLAWLYVYGEWPQSVLDHINRDTTDNRIANLRLTDKSGNASNNKAKLREDYGVYWHKQAQKWRVQLYINQRNRGFGLYASKEEAVAVAQQKRHEYGV